MQATAMIAGVPREDLRVGLLRTPGMARLLVTAQPGLYGGRRRC
jgi:hypothetical protein